MNNKKILAIICAAALAASGCAAADSSSEETSDAQAQSQAQSDSSSRAVENAAPAQDSSAEQVKELSLKVEQLSKRIDELEGKVETFSYDCHEIYDDTAVIDAYKKSDSSSLTDEKDKFIYDNLTAALKELIKDGMTDYDKEKAVYDYIFKGANFNYNNLNPLDDDSVEDNSHNPYGFFHDHSVICVGYATTFKLFMDALGIDCMIIHSTEQGEHAWNVVKIGGEWHHVDVFFDGGNYKPLYGSFNVTDSIKELQGYPWNTGSGPEYPECTSLKYSPVVREAKDCDSIYDLPKLLKDITESGEVLYIKLAVPEEAGLYGFSQQLDAIFANISFSGRQFSYRLMADPDTGACYAAMCVEKPEDYPDYEDEDPEDPIPDDRDVRPADIDYGKLTEGFSSTFGGEVSFCFDPDDYFGEGSYYGGLMG